MLRSSKNYGIMKYNNMKRRQQIMKVAWIISGAIS